MAVKTGVTEAPYDSGGNLQHWAPRPGTYGGDSLRWLPNDPFKGSLRLTGMQSGRSAKYVIWTAGDGRTYPMFITDLVDLIQRGHIADGWSHGPWIVRKRGQNYGIALPKDVP